MVIEPAVIEPAVTEAVVVDSVIAEAVVIEPLVTRAATKSIIEPVAEPVAEFIAEARAETAAQSTVESPLEQYLDVAPQPQLMQQSVEVAAPAPIALERFTPENWIQLRRQLSIGASLGEIASHCLYLGRNGQQLNFLIDSDHNSLYDDPHQEQFSEALSDYFQQPVTVEITLGVAEKETPRAATTREKAERLVEAVNSLNQDPAVVKFKQFFDGALDERSVRPID